MRCALEIRREEEEEGSSFGSVVGVAATEGRWEEEVERKRRASDPYGDLKRERGEVAGRGLAIRAKWQEGFGFYLFFIEREMGGWLTNHIGEENARGSYLSK